MADMSSFDSALEKALLSLSGLGVSLKLRSEERKLLWRYCRDEIYWQFFKQALGKAFSFSCWFESRKSCRVNPHVWSLFADAIVLFRSKFSVLQDGTGHVTPVFACEVFHQCSGLLVLPDSHNNIPWGVHVHNFYLKSCLRQVIHVQSSQHLIFVFWWRPTFSGKCEKLSRFLIWSHLRWRLDSGELTRISFAILHDGLACFGVASVCFVPLIGVPLIVGKVATFTSLNKWPRLTILRP